MKVKHLTAEELNVVKMTEPRQSCVSIGIRIEDESGAAYGMGAPLFTGMALTIQHVEIMPVVLLTRADLELAAAMLLELLKGYDESVRRVEAGEPLE